MKLAVYGLSILVVSGTPKKPYWVPLELFKIIDNNISSNWLFGVVHDHSAVRAVWGYKSLICDPRHHDDLIERKAEARDAFLSDCNLESLETALLLSLKVDRLGPAIWQDYVVPG